MTISMQDIEIRSYLIWEKEGRPWGHEWEHWFRAESELAEEQGSRTAKPERAAPASRRKKRKVPEAVNSAKA